MGPQMYLPTLLTHENINKFLLDLSANKQNNCILLWDKVQWVDIQEYSTLMAYCAKLVHANISVSWDFNNAPSDKLDNLRFNAERILGEYKYSKWTKYILTTTHDLKLNNFKPSRVSRCWDIINDQLLSIKKLSSQQRKIIKDWLHLEFRRLRKALVVGYLNRFDALTTAKACGIDVSPSFFDTGIVNYPESRDTPILPFTIISSTIDINRLLDSLNNKKELERIFGKYTSLDLIERGC